MGRQLPLFLAGGGGTRLWAVSVDGDQDPIPLQEKGHGYRPSFSVGGEWIYFFSKADQRDQIHKISAKGGVPCPLANDDKAISRAPFVDPNGKILLMHSYRSGAYMIWEVPLDGSPAKILRPPGFEVATHPTRSETGVVTFDVPRYRSSLRRNAARLKRRALSYLEYWTER